MPLSEYGAAFFLNMKKGDDSVILYQLDPDPSFFSIKFAGISEIFNSLGIIDIDQVNKYTKVLSNRKYCICIVKVA